MARRPGFVVLVALSTLLGLAACSSASATYAPVADYGGPDSNVWGGPTMAPAASMAAAGAASTPGAEEAGAAGSAGPGYQAGDGAPIEQQIVKTGTITILVATIDSSIVQATDTIHGLGGWLAGSERSSNTSTETASVTYRIPVARFEDALGAMRKLGTKVISEHTESTPVGGQIVDLQARIANLKATEQAIQAVMAQAKTIQDILSVQERLTEVQGEIEELSGQLAGLTDTATYSTLTVVFETPITNPTPTPSPTPSPTATPTPWSAGTQIQQATGQLGEFAQTGTTLLIWVLIVVLPIALGAILLLVLLTILWRVVRAVVEPTWKRLTYTTPQPDRARWGYGAYASPMVPSMPVAPAGAAAVGAAASPEAAPPASPAPSPAPARRTTPRQTGS